MSATRARCLAVLGCLMAVLVAGSAGVCQTGGAKVTIVVTGPMRYVVRQQGSLVADEATLPGAQIGLEAVDVDAAPAANSAPTTPATAETLPSAYDVPLLDLFRPQGALDAVSEGPPIVLTPSRLAALRRRHAAALADGFSEQAWNEVVADLVGMTSGAGPHAGRPVGGPPRGGKPGGPPEAGGPGPGREGAWELPQKRLLWELLKLASAPRLFSDFDAANRPRVWGTLSDTPAVSETGAQLSEAGSQRELLAASAGVQGLVLVKNEDGDLVAPGRAVEVVIIGSPGGHQKTWTVQTNSVGYFCWPLPEEAAGAGKLRVGVPGTDQTAEVAAEGGWSNVVIISAGPLPEGQGGEKGIGREGPGAFDAVSAMGALTGLLAGTAAGKIVPALSSTGLPLQTGVVWSPRASVRAYYGVERTLAPSYYDRSVRPLAPANVVIEFLRYPLVSQPRRTQPGEIERSYVERAKALSDAAHDRYQRAKDDAEAAGAQLDRLTKVIKDAHPETDAASYKALVESQIALHKDCHDRRAEVEALSVAAQVQLDFCDLCQARELQAKGPKGTGAQAMWNGLCASYNHYGQLPGEPSTDDIAVLVARIEQKVADDCARAEKLGPDAQFQDPRLEHLAYEGTPQWQEKLGYVRFVRVHLIARGIPADSLSIASRLRPGHYGLSAGMVVGNGGSQPAVGGWWLWERAGLRLTAGSTFSGGGQPGELMLGCGVQVPLGNGNSQSAQSGGGGGYGGGGSGGGGGGASGGGGGGGSSATATGTAGAGGPGGSGNAGGSGGSGGGGGNGGGGGTGHSGHGHP